MMKLMKKALLGTLAGVMAVSTPLAVFAAEENATEQVVVEEAAEQVTEDQTTEAAAEETTFEEAVEQTLDFVLAFLEDSEVRSETFKACLDGLDLNLTEEEKQEIADQLANMTWEEWQEAGEVFVEFLNSEEFKEAVAEATDELEAELEKMAEEALRESAAELEEVLNELGQELIDVNVDDILAFFE